MSATMHETTSGILVEKGLDFGIRIVLERRSSAAPERWREPVTFGIPFPKGALEARRRLALIDADGQLVPTQTRTLDQWSDGSVRWLLVDAQLNAGAGRADEYQLRPVDAPLPSQLIVTEADGRLTISQGAIEFRLRAGGPFPFESILVDGQPAVDPKASGIVAHDDYGECSVTIGRLAVEEAGPLRTVVLAEGRITNSRGEIHLELVLRLHFFADSPVVRILACVRNPRRAEHGGGFWDLGDKGSVYLKDLSLTIAMPPSPTTATTAISVDGESPFESVAGPVSLYQDSSGGDNWRSSNHINRRRVVPNTFRGYRVYTSAGTREGVRATPTVVVRRGADCLAATMPHFWQNFPKAIEAADGTLVVRLFPGQYADLHEIQGGEQKTHELFVAFGPDRITAQPLDWCRARIVPRAEPSWYCSSGAIPYLTSHDVEADRPRVGLTHAAIEGNDTFGHKRERVDEYGWRHFGDIYGDHEAVRQPGLVSHYNNQYDPILGFARQFMSSGDVRWWTQMEELASHVVDIDEYHTDRDKSAYNHGLFWHTFHYGDADTATHRTYPRAAAQWTAGGGPSGEHNYTTGLMFHYFLCGDAISRDTAVSLAQFVIDADDGSKTVFKWLDRGHTGYPTASGSYGYHGPGRGSANSLNALLNAFRLTGGRQFIDKAELVVRRCIHPADDVASRDLLDVERKWFYTMFLQALGGYLDEKAERGELDAMYAYGRASLLRYARWMADHETPYLDHPERLEFPTETWAAQDIRKSDVFYHAMRYAPETERERFRERGVFFFRYATKTLLSMPTRTLARPVVVLLTNGVLHSWFAAHADVRAIAPAGTTSFGAPTPFVSQQVVAVRRAKLVATAAVALVLSALLYVACHG